MGQPIANLDDVNDENTNKDDDIMSSGVVVDGGKKKSREELLEKENAELWARIWRLEYKCDQLLGLNREMDARMQNSLEMMHS